MVDLTTETFTTPGTSTRVAATNGTAPRPVVVAVHTISNPALAGMA